MKILPRMAPVASRNQILSQTRNSEPGLDIPQTRQRLEPVLTCAPQPLQAKVNIALRVAGCHGKNTSSLRLFCVESRRCRFQGGFWYLSVFEDARSGALPWTAATTLPGRRFRFWKLNR
jgi:hypothetical protein